MCLCLLGTWHMGELCKNGWTNRDAVWWLTHGSKEPCVRCRSRSDECTRCREEWHDSDAVSCQFTWDICITNGYPRFRMWECWMLFMVFLWYFVPWGCKNSSDSFRRIQTATKHVFIFLLAALRVVQHQNFSCSGASLRFLCPTVVTRCTDGVKFGVLGWLTGWGVELKILFWSLNAPHKCIPGAILTKFSAFVAASCWVEY